MSTFKERDSSTLTDETCENSPLFVSCHHYFASFGVCMYSHTVYLWTSEKSDFKQNISIRVNGRWKVLKT